MCVCVSVCGQEVQFVSSVHVANKYTHNETGKQNPHANWSENRALYDRHIYLDNLEQGHVIWALKGNQIGYFNGAERKICQTSL